jgi:hypothetical protein
MIIRKSSFKNCLAILIFIGGFIFQVNAQTTEVFEDWATYKGTQNMFYKNFTTTDLNRNVFVAGATLNATGNYDILLTKYDAEGVEQWTQQYAGSGNGDDAATSLCFDNNGNIYLTGTVYKNTTEVENCITIKYNQNGVQQWVRTFNGNASGIDFGTSIKADFQNNVYISGATTQSNSLLDFLIIKYDENGTLQWSNTYNHINLNDVSNKINIFDDIVVVAGGAQVTANEWEYAITEFDANTGSFFGASVTNSSGTGIDNIKDLTIDQNGFLYVTGGIVNSNNGYDYYTMKLDTSLNFLWSATYNGNSNLDDIANSVYVDYAGNVYVTGSSNTTNQGKNWITIKYNSAGIQQWTASFNDNYDEDDEANALALDNSGNIYVAGYTYNGDNLDYKTIKYDPNGNVKWEIEFNSLYNDDDKATNISVDNNGDIIVAGQSYIGTDYKFVTVKYIEEEIIIPPDPEALSNALSFDENRGQLLNTSGNIITEVKYYSNAFSQSLYFRDDKLSYVISQKNEAENTQEYSRVDMTFVNSTPTKVRALNINEDYKNFYYPHISEGRERVRNYDNLIYKDVFEYIDVVFSNNNKGLKYYFVVKPSASANLIKLNYEGAISISTNSNNELIISTNLGDIKQAQLTVFQIDANGNRVSLGWQPTYVVNGTQVSFTIGSYNSSLPLVIQVYDGPQLNINNSNNLCWSTYFGGNDGESIYGVDVDNNENQFFTGYTTSSNFPILGNSSSNSSNGNKVFISKFYPNHELVWSTYYGGTDHQAGNDIKCKNNGNIYVTGYTIASDFVIKTKQGAYSDNSYGGNYKEDGFISEFSSSGALQWSTYFGDNQTDIITSIEFDNNSNFYIVGKGGGNGFPLVSLIGAYNQQNAGGTDAFIAKFDNNCALVWSTFYGGASLDMANSIKIDALNNVFVSGNTYSSNFPLMNSNNAFYDNTLGGSSDDWILKFSNTGVRQWATYIGGSSAEYTLYGDAGNRIAIDNQNNILLVGSTGSSDFPVTKNNSGYFYGPPNNSWSDHSGYIMQFNANDYSLMWNTLISGSGTGQVHLNAIDLNSANKIIVGGGTSNQNFPIVAEQSMYNQPNLTQGSSSLFAQDACLLGFNSAHNLIYGSFFGGDNVHPEGDFITDLIINNNNLFFTGYTSSHSITGGSVLPLSNPGNNAYFDNSFNSSNNKADGFIAKQCIEGLVSIDEYKQSDDYKLLIYPNPVQNKLHISIESTLSKKVEILIYDYTGKIVASQVNSISIGSNSVLLDVSALSKGIYLIQIDSNYSSKFVKL